MNTVRFFAANTQPNPVEVDYWVDLYDNPYGGSIKYYNGTEWVRLAASGGIPDLSKYYTKVQVNQLLNDKASVQSVESKVDDEEVKDVIKNITFRTSNPNEVQMVLAKYDTTTVAISLPKASDVSAGIVTSDDFKDFVKQVDLQQLYQELYDSNSSIITAINDIKAKYQKKLIAGSNIKISDDNVISATISIEGSDIDVDGINSKIDELTGKLQDEVTRSTNADNKLTRDLSTESTTARAAEKKNADNIASNTQAIQKEVTDRNAAIKVETDRATAAENKLANDIVTTVETEKDRAEGVEQVIINDLAEEVTRAKAAEQANKTAINKEVTDRQSAIATEVDNRNAAIEVEKQRALKAEATLDTRITTHTNEINTALATKADKSTTYNKTEVDSEINTINQTKQDKLTAGSGIKIENNTISSTLDVQLYKIVESLPSQDIEPSKIYLVLSEISTESNKYTEYVYVNGEWEIMGSYTANADLSGYLTKTDAASTYQPKGNYALKTDIPDVSDKADTSYVNSQIQTVNTEMNKKANKADLSLVATSGSYNDLTNKLKAGSGVTITEDNTINTSVDLSGVTNSISELDSKIEAEISRATIAESNKVDKQVGKGLSTNDYTTDEKNKLAGIASGAEVNVQSDWNQTSTSADDYIKNKPVAATTSKDGFMSAADKTKLDGIAEGANVYTLPAATSQVLGGVKIGSNITLADGGVISINKTNVTTALGYTPLESVDTSNFVTLNNDQTITGAKTFTSDVKTNSGIWSDSKDFIIINRLSDTSTPKISFRVANSAGSVTYFARTTDFSNNNNRNLGNTVNKWGTLYVNSVESSTIVNSGLILSNSFQSNVPTGTAPFNCVSTTVNPNLNAGLFNGASIINNNFIYLTKQELKFTYNESAEYLYVKITHTNQYNVEQLNIKIETNYQNKCGVTYLYRDGFSNKYRVYITNYNNSNIKGISTAVVNNQPVTYLKLSNKQDANIKVFSNYHFDIEEVTDVSDITFDDINSGIYISYPIKFFAPVVADIKGNSDSSTKLQTARQINGTNFDGTNNITTAKWGTSRNLTIGKTAKAVDGSNEVSWLTSEIADNATTTTDGWMSKEDKLALANLNSDFYGKEQVTVSVKKDGVAHSVQIDIKNKDNDEVIATSTGSSLTTRIVYGVKYYVSVPYIEGYSAANESSEYTASQQVRAINIEYMKYDEITIDQTVTDPNTMISGDVNGTVLQWIRNNTHRYVAKKTGDGQVTICQLSDNDTTKFYDNLTSSSDYISNINYDVFVRIPRFWYKATETTTNVWKIKFSNTKQSSTWKEWDGNDLIGAYEGYAASSTLHSRSNVGSTGDISQTNFKAYARQKGTGYTLVKWKHHCIVGVLYYALYGNTNCQATIGSGTNSYTKNTGLTNSLGMNDSSASATGNSGSINFLGLENWWGNKYEFIDNATFNHGGTDYKFYIVEDDGSSREVQAHPHTDTFYPTVMVFGEYLDLVMKPNTTSGTTSTGFCDSQYFSGSSNQVVRRSYGNSNADGGVAYLGTNNSASSTSAGIGSRLAFRGTIIEEKDIETFKALK